MKYLLLYFNIILLSVCLRIENSDKKDSKNSHSYNGFNQKDQQHKYYNLQESSRVSQSRSIKYLNQCKDLCLQMHKLFPFQFKYHRLIYRQQNGEMKYFTGQCLYTFRDQSSKRTQINQKKLNQTQKQQKNKQQENKQKTWYQWSKLKQFVDMSTVFDKTYEQEKKAWKSYFRDCEDESLKLTDNSKIDFKFDIVHSNFEYYQNQGFKNLQPFDDLGDLFKGLSPKRSFDSD